MGDPSAYTAVHCNRSATRITTGNRIGDITLNILHNIRLFLLSVCYLTARTGQGHDFFQRDYNGESAGMLRDLPTRRLLFENCRPPVNETGKARQTFLIVAPRRLPRGQSGESSSRDYN
jgi:hypothetical protein